jgi:hypothetical protein
MNMKLGLPIKLLTLYKKYNKKKTIHTTKMSSRASSKLTVLPDDVLYHIAEFITPLCSKERFDMLTDTIIPSLPEFSRYFTRDNTYCSLEDHIYINNTTICIYDLNEYINDENLRKYYFKNIIQDLACQKQLNVTCKKAKYNLENQHYALDYYLDNTNTFTYHFNNKQYFNKDHPLICFIIQNILPLTKYRFSHMCCSGSGIFCSEVM